ncbi:MAG: MFS transporter [Ilumatobacteraceae bacterium]|jgi:predicted MFS family arabinose efflux permease|nr:MFS transporter [Ilumatobacteraceae bacterium]
MFGRRLDDTYAPEVRAHLTTLTVARLISNACYRFAPPFVATIARGFDVSVGELGIALMVGELAGLLAPFIGRVIDRSRRRNSMLVGMTSIVASVILAAASNSLVLFTIAVFALSLSKVMFDSSMVVWINDHVPYERRGRVIGIIETSWALGLLIGVLTMGLVTELVNWRAGYVVGAIAMFLSLAAVSRKLPEEPPRPSENHVTNGSLRGAPLLIVGTMFCLMAASQSLGITFGAWLEDDHGANAAAISAVVFFLGALELIASVTSARRTDTWGKERSVMYGAAMMVPSGLLLVFGADRVILGLVLFIVFIGAFEFAVVSALPIAANLIPGSTGVGLGAAVGAGTFGRAVMSAIATALYESYGFAAPGVVGAVLALTAGALTLAYSRTQRANSMGANIDS